MKIEGFQVIENMERETGLEPATSSLGSWHSTTELLPRSVKSAGYLAESIGQAGPKPSLFCPCRLSNSTRLVAKMDSKTNSTTA